MARLVIILLFCVTICYAAVFKDGSLVRKRKPTEANRSKFNSRREIAWQNTKNTACTFSQFETCTPCLCVEDVKMLTKFYCDCRKLKHEKDCLKYHQKGFRVNGVYTMKLNNKAVDVFCDQQTDGGGWTVFQRRIDGSINFYRNWTEYKQGFGSLQNEFYFGNDNIHLLTTQFRVPEGNELRIDLRSWSTGQYKYAKYSSFQISDEYFWYILYISGYSGNAEDCMTMHNKARFSTFDNDHDDLPYFNCARSYHGAWWYRKCYFANLNGAYDVNNTRDASERVNWNGLGFWQYQWRVSFVEMKTRSRV